MSMTDAIDKVLDAIKPAKVLTFDSPRQMAIAYSLIEWSNYKCQDLVENYEHLNLCLRDVPFLVDPTNNPVLEQQLRTVVRSINRQNDLIYKGVFREIAEFEPGILICDKFFGREKTDIGIKCLRDDLLSGSTEDMAVYREGWGSSYGHCRSRFLTPSIDSWWVMPMKDMALVCLPPIFTHIDEEGRLHSKDYPAVEYKDGFQVWAWRGRVLKREYIVKPSNLPFSMHEDSQFEGLYWIESSTQFHDFAELVGYSYFYEHAEKEVLDEDYDRKKVHRLLIRLKWGCFRDDIHLLVLGDGKSKAYLKVPRDIRTCATATAWTFGKRVNEYSPIEET